MSYIAKGITVPILPGDHEYLTFIKKVVRYHARRSGYKRITVPVLATKELLERVLGEASPAFVYDVAEKDGYAMRPMYTPLVMDAYRTCRMDELPLPVEYYYIDEIWQKQDDETLPLQRYVFGFEHMGESDPAVEAQLLEMGQRIFKDLGLHDIKLRINTVGSRASQEAYAEDIRNFFGGRERALSELDKQALDLSPLRIMDSKEEDTQILVKMAPDMSSVLDEESLHHYTKVKEYLEELGIQYEEDAKYFGGLDMYTHTVFEFYSEHAGEKIVLARGGRYDDAMRDIANDDVPAVHFEAFMDDIATLMKVVHLRVPSKDKAQVFVVQIGEDAKKVSLKLVSDLRAKGIKTLGALGKDSIRSQLETAGKFEVDYALVLGQMEVREKKIIIRDMKKGTQEVIPLEGIVAHMTGLLGEHTLDTKNFQEMIEEANEED